MSIRKQDYSTSITLDSVDAIFGMKHGFFVIINALLEESERGRRVYNFDVCWASYIPFDPIWEARAVMNLAAF